MEFEEEEKLALTLLTNKNILEITNEEFNKTITGEVETRKAIFICSLSCLVDNLQSHFNIFVNSESSAGKSYITKQILKILPTAIFKEKGKDSTYRTRISPMALTYWHNTYNEPSWTWDGRVLYLEDVGHSVLNSDVFRVYCSEGSTTTIVGKKKSMNSEMPSTFDIDIKGKPVIFITTARGTESNEILNRFIMISLDETEEQSEKIMEHQIKIGVAGKCAEYDKVFEKAFGYLKRYQVLIPIWIKNLIKQYPKQMLRVRRDFPRFLDLMRCSAILHQYQREKTEDGKLVANEIDYDIAYKCLMKIQDSSTFYGLTHKHKKAYEFIIKFYKKFNRGCSRMEIYAFAPIYSDVGWRDVLDKLASIGLLVPQIKEEEEGKSGRKTTIYAPLIFSSILLPTSLELISYVSDVSNVSINSDVSNVSNGINVKSDLENGNEAPSMRSFATITYITEPSVLEKPPENYHNLHNLHNEDKEKAVDEIMKKFYKPDTLEDFGL